MTKPKPVRFWATLLILNSAFWVGFWLYFFMHSVVTPQHLRWEETPLFYSVLNRSFSATAPDVFHSFMFQTAFWLNLPCWLLTWPIGRIVGAHEIMGTNAAGMRLICITVLSYAQWYGVVRLLGFIWKRPRPHQQPRIA